MGGRERWSAATIPSLGSSVDELARRGDVSSRQLARESGLRSDRVLEPIELRLADRLVVGIDKAERRLLVGVDGGEGKFFCVAIDSSMYSTSLALFSSEMDASFALASSASPVTCAVMSSTGVAVFATGFAVFVAMNVLRFGCVCRLQISKSSAKQQAVRRVA